MSEPLVSIIIPVFNCGSRVETAVNSVLNQSLGSIEVICVDDGSTDNSSEEIKRLAQNDPRVKYLYQVNSGAGTARNNGMNAASGRFIGFLDADDWYPNPDSLRQLYDAAIMNNCDISGGCIEVESRGRLISYGPDSPRGRSFLKTEVIDYKDFQESYFYVRFLFSRSFLEKNNLYFPAYRRFQDPPFFVKAMISAGSFVAVPVTSYHYNSGYKKVEWNCKKFLDWCSGVDDVLGLARKHGFRKLYENTLRDFDTKELAYALVRLTEEGFSEPFEFVKRINDSVDWEFAKLPHESRIKALSYVRGNGGLSVLAWFGKCSIIIERELKSFILKRMK